jgi:transcription antitermination factor NusG
LLLDSANRLGRTDVRKASTIKLHQESPFPGDLDSYDYSSDWFALRVTYGRQLKLQAKLKEQGIKTFIPMRAEFKIVDGKGKRVRTPAINNLIFVYSIREIIDECISREGENSMTRYMWDKFTRKPIIVPEKQMNDFIKVSSTEDEELIYLTDVSAKLRAGQKVRVTAGPFAGIEGTIVRIRKSRRVLVEIPGLLALATAYIPFEFLQAKDDAVNPAVTLKNQQPLNRLPYENR